MSHYKRHHPRRQVKCNICTDARVGNGKAGNGRRDPRIGRRRTSRRNSYVN